MRQRSFITLLIVIVVAGGIIGGAFVGGMALGKSQGEEEANQDMFSQFQSHFGTEGPQEGEGTFQPGDELTEGFGGLVGRGATMGTVEEVENNTITLSMAGNTVHVIVSEDTIIQKMGEGSLDDILPGTSISVTGEELEDGSIEATNIFVTPEVAIQQ
jgi:hypothetical protein